MFVNRQSFNNTGVVYSALKRNRVCCDSDNENGRISLWDDRSRDTFEIDMKESNAQSSADEK